MFTNGGGTRHTQTHTEYGKRVNGRRKNQQKDEPFI